MPPPTTIVDFVTEIKLLLMSYFTKHIARPPFAPKLHDMAPTTFTRTVKASTQGLPHGHGGQTDPTDI